MSTARVVPFVLSSPSVAAHERTFVRSRLRTTVPSGIIRPHLPSTEKAGNLPGATHAGAPSNVSYERTYVEHAELIEGVLTLICRRHRLVGMEADDFRSIARLKLVDNDYEVLR